MSGSLRQLQISLKATESYGNDHDFICHCRPVDVRKALDLADHIQAILRLTGSYMLTCKRNNTDEWMEEFASRIQQFADVLGESVDIRYDASRNGGILTQTERNPLKGNEDETED